MLTDPLSRDEDRELGEAESFQKAGMDLKPVPAFLLFRDSE